MKEDAMTPDETREPVDANDPDDLPPIPPVPEELRKALFWLSFFMGLEGSMEVLMWEDKIFSTLIEACLQAKKGELSLSEYAAAVEQARDTSLRRLVDQQVKALRGLADDLHAMIPPDMLEFLKSSDFEMEQADRKRSNWAREVNGLVNSLRHYADHLSEWKDMMPSMLSHRVRWGMTTTAEQALREVSFVRDNFDYLRWEHGRSIAREALDLWARLAEKGAPPKSTNNVD
jgi:hypothetical protein